MPRLCVEVKSGDTPIDRPTVDKLLGVATKFGAQESLFVSWSGFKSNVQKELAASFFRVRLWSQKELLEALFANYDRLDPDIKAELSLSGSGRSRFKKTNLRGKINVTKSIWHI